MEELIKKLKELYPNIEFAEGNESGNKILLYGNRDLMWDDEFNDKALELAEKCLKEDEYDSFAYVYDFLDEMSATLEVQNQSEFKVIKRVEIRDFRLTLEKRCETYEYEEDVANDFNGINNIFLLKSMAIID
ncbi:hypothetical protein [Clostridium vincentii]|uniref:Uncharacterized protein n=1 Tax=Clostridium vincentii TaxID=52704 RepID=A0A2T0B7A0_9CLOT|nr:hypothetical protein [Clostridium vincentii]PRR79778.1 hypothetical protein CLVI_32240 [Clostridium vincentii]